jgi:hypothetical protein
MFNTNWVKPTPCHQNSDAHKAHSRKSLVHMIVISMIIESVLKLLEKTTIH